MILTRTLFLSSILGLAPWACTHDLGTLLLDREVDTANERARGRLKVADVAGARSEYASVLEIDPRNSEASFGFVLADLLLLAESAPIEAVLDRCHQPTFDAPQQIFGPDGLLAREERAGAGRATLDVHFFSNPSSAASRTDFQPSRVLSEVTTRNLDGVAEPRIVISISDANDRNGARLSIELNPDDLTRGDVEVLPLTAGTVIDLGRSTLDGELSVYEPARLAEAEGYYRSTAASSGKIHVLAGGRYAGDTLSLRFEDLVVPHACPDPNCEASHRISGDLEDTLTNPVEIDPKALPFGSIDDDEGPPARSALVVLLEQCSPIDTTFLAATGKALGDALAEDAMRLSVILEDSRREDFVYLIPRELLHSERDLPLHVNDVRVLKAAAELLAAGLELAAQFQYSTGPLQGLIQEFDRFADTDESPIPVRGRVRDFEPSLVAQNLALVFLTRASSFDLSTFERRIDAGLGGLADALESEEALPEGVLDLRARSFRHLAADLASGFRAMKESIRAERPVAWPASPLYGFHWKAFLDAPLDRERLLLLTGLDSLVRYVAGDPQGSTADQRNAAVAFELDLFLDALLGYFERTGGTSIVIETWLGGLLSLPPDRSEAICASAAECGAGYACLEDRCLADLPFALTESAWSEAARDDWPEFVNPTLRDVLGL